MQDFTKKHATTIITNSEGMTLTTVEKQQKRQKNVKIYASPKGIASNLHGLTRPMWAMRVIQAVA
jgi:hypothetical protein